jgi:hypothetical protein
MESPADYRRSCRNHGREKRAQCWRWRSRWERSATPQRFAHALLAYDDIKSIRYFSDDLVAYWKKDGATIDDLLQTAEKEFAYSHNAATRSTAS